MSGSRSETPAHAPGGDSGLASVSNTELASYIEDMTAELEKLARGGGLTRLGELLRAAGGEARRVRRH